MQILVHIGLNKCASTYIQVALHAAAKQLRRKGVLYSTAPGRSAQYGLSRNYGFGPDLPDVTPQSLGQLAREAENLGCGRIIVSSEFFSIARPTAIAALARDMDALQAESRILLFSRDVESWVRSLFNQHVKTVDGGPYFQSINTYVDHVLERGSIDIVKRYRAWAETFGTARIDHYHITPAHSSNAVLRPFADFAGIDLRPSEAADNNQSLSPGALYLTGLVRRAPPSRNRNFVLSSIAKQDCRWVPVPPDYLEIDAIRRARLEELVAAPFAGLPRKDLTVHAGCVRPCH